MNTIEKRSIDNLVKKLNSSILWSFGFYLRYRFGKKDIITNNYTHGYVDEHEIIYLVKRSVSLTFTRWMIPHIINLIDSMSFTNEVVSMCQNYPSNWRSTLLEAVAHKNLSIDCMIKINEAIHTPEAFYKILIYNLTEGVDIDSFVGFLNTNNRFKTEFANNGYGIVDKYKNASNLDLINVLCSWSRKTGDGSLS